MVENVVVTLDQKQVLELEEIIVDTDKDAAFKFLKDNVYKIVKKQQEQKGC